MVLENVIGGCIAAIVAGMPAVIALLKINQLHFIVNSRMDKFIEATLVESKQREEMVLKETESRVLGIAHSRDLLVLQNNQLIDHLAELAKRIESLPCSVHVSPISTEEKPPCTV